MVEPNFPIGHKCEQVSEAGLALGASSTDSLGSSHSYVVPALFLAASGLLAYRTFREPYER